MTRVDFWKRLAETLPPPELGLLLAALEPVDGVMPTLEESINRVISLRPTGVSTERIEALIALLHRRP